MTELLVLSQGDREKKGDTPRRPPLAPRGAPPPALPPPPCWPHSFLLPSPFFLIIFLIHSHCSVITPNRDFSPVMWPLLLRTD